MTLQRTQDMRDLEFALSLVPQLESGKGNVVFSPWSIRTALSMIYEGANGDTAAEIADAAFIVKNRQERHQEIRQSMDLLNQSAEDLRIRAANGIWTDNKFQINPVYAQIIKDAYHGQATNADFIRNYEFWRGKINEWVGQITEGKITELFPSGSIDSLSVLVLANALYFKGKWENKFDGEFTQKQDFTLPSSDVVKVDMMRKGEVEKAKAERGWKLPKFRYNSFDGNQVVALPYRGHRLEKVVLLPTKATDITQLESQLQNNAAFNNWYLQLREAPFARLELPRHEVRGRYGLIDPLKTLGIKRMFNVDTAELSGIGPGPLYVSSGVHEAYFKTDEEGSEGAAATGFAVSRLCIMDELKPVEFVADHPFLELIVDRPTNSVLFYNRITDPR